MKHIKRDKFWAVWHTVNQYGQCLCGKKIDGQTIDELPEGEEICWSCNHVLNSYEVKTIQAGQLRNYGPTIHKYHIRDLTGKRGDDEALTYCRQHVRSATLIGEEGYHVLDEHVQEFRRIEDSLWLYQTGHEYTG